MERNVKSTRNDEKKWKSPTLIEVFQDAVVIINEITMTHFICKESVHWVLVQLLT